MRGVGMNVNLAPVLGVFRQAGDFLDQFQRSFSRDPVIVVAAGAAFLTAQQSEGWPPRPSISRASAPRAPTRTRTRDR